MTRNDSASRLPHCRVGELDGCRLNEIDRYTLWVNGSLPQDPLRGLIFLKLYVVEQGALPPAQARAIVEGFYVELQQLLDSYRFRE